ncbi:MAG: DsbA family protein [Gulosibacter sp.]|uniref:DsbA family protein n=1 Tax=Gulosibacter sp. TaxID=2817531 RepID=UPI003F90F031
MNLTAPERTQSHPVRRRWFTGVAAVLSFALLTGCASMDAEEREERGEREEESSADVADSDAESGEDNSFGDESNTEAGGEYEAPQYMVRGEADAPNTVEVYLDYLCPHCATFSEGIESEIVAEFVDSGDAKIIYHDFIIIDPEGSTMLAVAARAAGLQDKYAEFHDLVLSEQSAISDSPDGITVDLLVDYADEAGVADLDAFAAEVSGMQLQAEVDASSAAASDAGIAGTPTVIVNGEPVADLSFESISALLESE